MKTYAITGGATGIGAALKQKLLSLGYRVIVIDIQQADIIADLSTIAGRHVAITELNNLASKGLDGFIPCAGLGPNTTPYSLITKVNFFGAIELISGITPLLIQRKGAVVAIASNSAALPGLDENYIAALMDENEALACDHIETLDGHNAYAGSKHALIQWVRTKAPAMIQQGVRMNVIAPGMTATPLTDKVFKDPVYGNAMQEFSALIPAGAIAHPDMVADSILFLLSPAARYICGSVLFVDGGQDASFRPRKF